MGEPFIGEIKMFCGDYAPRGWLFCDGQILPIAQFNALFSLISFYYGGDGRTNFALPDLRGRVPINQGTGVYLTRRNIGTRAGEETVSLNLQEIPSHRHALTGTNAAATTNNPSAATFSTCPTNVCFYNDAVSEHTDPLNAQTIGSSGNGSEHLNMMPFTVVNFIIATEGIYPSRS